MQTIGKFTLCTMPEFEAWLMNRTFNRVIRLVQNHHTYKPGYEHFKGNNRFSPTDLLMIFYTSHFAAYRLL